MPERVLGKRRRLVFGSVVLEKLIGRELDRLPLLFPGFRFEDLAVAFLQSLPLTALLLDGLLLVSRAGGTPAAPTVQLELVMVEPAVFENAHSAELSLDTIQVLRLATVKSKFYGGGLFRAWDDH